MIIHGTTIKRRSTFCGLRIVAARHVATDGNTYMTVFYDYVTCSVCREEIRKLKK
jgi:hypothetical protein